MFISNDLTYFEGFDFDEIEDVEACEQDDAS
jgi:hypothetical protein